MSILDEKEPTISLKLIVVIVSVITFGAFGSMFIASNVAQASATHSHSQSS